MFRTCKQSGIIFLVFSLLSLICSAEEADLDKFFRAVTDGRANVVAPLLAKNPSWANRELFFGIRPLYRASVLGRVKVAKILLECGAEPATATERGNLPLHAASQNGYPEIVTLLVNAKTPLETKNPFQSTALHLAARYKNAEVVKILLEAGADPNPRDSVGRTPLHFAAGLGRMDLVRPLVESGADLSVVDSEGYTALGWARTLKRNSFGDVGGFLEQKGAIDVRPEKRSDK